MAVICDCDEILKNLIALNNQEINEELMKNALKFDNSSLIIMLLNKGYDPHATFDIVDNQNNVLAKEEAPLF